MLFNSLNYLLFLPLVVLVYYQLSLRQRQLFILLASYAFYWFWSFKFSALLLITTVVDYAVALWLGRTVNERKRKWIIWVSMLSNLAMLGVFKYADFLSGSFAEVLGWRPWPALHLILPLGISFYTFMSMSYVIDVYRREIEPRRSLLQMALFTSYFPHLVAGPILRAPDLLPQLEAYQPFRWANIRRGVALILWGMLLKVYLADPMSHIVNETYAGAERASGFGLAMATYAFTAQIFCDFAGYSDIAIGSALILGVRLNENFDRPYLAVTITEFWRKWHISLSTWLRDYLYIPLGGNRKGTARTYINLMITMLLGGLWHGAGWHWMIWGGIQGFALSIERALGIGRPQRRPLWLTALGWFITFHIVCLSWVFFRSQHVAHAGVILRKIASFAPGEYYGGWSPIVVLALLLLVERFNVRAAFVRALEERPVTLRWLAYASFLLLALTFSRADNPEFIYFQF